MRTYVDASFLVSLYSPDANSLLAVQAMQSHPADLLISSLSELEFFNALELRVFRKEIASAEAGLSRGKFERAIENNVFQLLLLPEQSFDRARQLALQTTARLGTRTADILHVAVALELKADAFYTFDRQQRKLAQSVRLKVN